MNFYVGKIMMFCTSPHTIVNLFLVADVGALVPSFITLW
jgi:hypothetical protein